MRPVDYILLAVAMLALGGVAGWSARGQTADHRYLRAQAEFYEAQKGYFDMKLDETIKENERIYGNGKKKN